MNTDHLGYKLISGKLKERRIHSEQLNKFLAGFFDADGCVTLFVDKRYGSIVLNASIVQSLSNDWDFEMMLALRDYYGIGKITYRSFEGEQNADAITWSFNVKESKMLFGLIGKHLFIKRDHFIKCIEAHEEYLGKKPEIEFIRSLRNKSREESCMNHKHFKHISTAYLAGLIAGDGWVEAAIGKKKFIKSKNAYINRNQMSIEIKLNVQDGEVLEAIHRDFGGSLYYRGHDNCIRWRLNMGKGNKNALELSTKLLGYMCMQKKYDSLELIRNFHKQLAETKHIETDKVM